MKDDADVIAQALIDRIEEVLDAFAPGWVSHRGRGYPLARGPKDLGSFSVHLKGVHRGKWYRFSQGIGGGSIKLVAYLLNGQAGEPTRDDWRRAFEQSRRFLGMDDREVDHAAAQRARDEAERKRQITKVEDEKAVKARQNKAAAIWEDTKPLPGTAAEAYLSARKLRLDPWPDCLRFHANLHHEVLDTFAPALVCRVDDEQGAFLGVWRIFVTHDGQKAFGGSSKMGRGPTGGGAVRLAAPSGGHVGIAEGVETALAVMLLSGGTMPVWSVLSTSGMAGWVPPYEIESVTIFPDYDLPRRRVDRHSGRVLVDERTGEVQWLPSPGLTEAQRTKARLEQAGLSCVIDGSRPRGGRDYADVWHAMADRLTA